MFYVEKEMKRWFLYGLAGWGLMGCSPVPDGILSQKEMQAVVEDMQIAEAMISSDRETYQDNAQKLALYESVFRKHHITRAEYDSSLVWYARNLDIYMRVYNMVTDGMEARIDALGDGTPSTSGREGPTSPFRPMPPSTGLPSASNPKSPTRLEAPLYGACRYGA